ncbi:hypothetical protein K0M31_003667 [Melipona bicolor]|uniref:Uncharacterized protein n=1 Tax=Melipona bicolor TaxID=60889 RepID=A0AA40FXC0_9HYME|nr:hypothetical protein K0M31_003667 [Melipona bicolor]
MKVVETTSLWEMLRSEKRKKLIPPIGRKMSKNKCQMIRQCVQLTTNAISWNNRKTIYELRTGGFMNAAETNATLEETDRGAARQVNLLSRWWPNVVEVSQGRHRHLRQIFQPLVGGWQFLQECFAERFALDGSTRLDRGCGL